MSNNTPPPGTGIHHLIAADLTVAARQDIAERVAAKLAAKRRRRRPRLARAREEAKKAGLPPIKAATLQPDGGWRLEFGAPSPAEVNEWDEEFSNGHDQAQVR